MKLDLRFNASLPPEVISLFDGVAKSNRHPFNDFIDSISRPLIDNLDWWSENAASRNTYVSPLFHYYCCINLIIVLIEEERLEIEEITVDSRELKNILEQLIGCYASLKIMVIYSPDFSVTSRRFLKNFIYYEWLILKRFIQIIFARLTRFTSNDSIHRIQGIPLVLIDTFVTKEFLEKDRWYGSFWDHLKNEQKKEVFFAPTIVNTSLKQIWKIINSLRHSSRNTIIKDDFLSAKDLLFAYLHKKRVKSIVVQSYKLPGTELDISGLAEEDLRNNRDVFSLLESLLTYRFIFKLSTLNVNIRLSIDWFEGHSLDKLWNLAFKEFYPSVKRIGYETFRSFPYYLSTFPTKLEKDAGTIPDVFAVQGEGCVDDIREFLPDIEVITIPAFKYEHVWKKDNNEIGSKGNNILVTFPISVDASVRIFELLITAYNSSKEIREDYKFLIKPHPTNTKEEIIKKTNIKIPKVFEFTEEESFEKLLDETGILVTEASSTCLEAFACGKVVIIVENPTGLTYDPVPKNIPDCLFERCRDNESLIRAVNKFLGFDEEDLKRNRNKGKEIRQEYFEEVSTEGIKRFLDLV